MRILLGRERRVARLEAQLLEQLKVWTRFMSSDEVVRSAPPGFPTLVGEALVAEANLTMRKPDFFLVASNAPTAYYQLEVIGRRLVAATDSLVDDEGAILAAKEVEKFESQLMEE